LVQDKAVFTFERSSQMRSILFILLIMIPEPLFAQNIPNIGLPAKALVIEEQSLKKSGYFDRALVLWMISPKKVPHGNGPETHYSCTDVTRGSYYHGPTRVSLVNTATGNVINTIKIDQDGEDSFDIPYAIRRGYYYRVESGAKKETELKPQILWLRDYNGDGTPLEFALFDAQACLGLGTTLIGYSPNLDKVIQYQIKLEIERKGKKSVEVSNWADYLFSKKPIKSGHWIYEVDYRGRCGSLDKYDISYNGKTEYFEGYLVSVDSDKVCK